MPSFMVLENPESVFAEMENQGFKLNIFNHPSWINTITYQYGFNPKIFCLRDEVGKIVACISFLEIKKFKRRKDLISLPFSDYSSPLYKDEKAFQILITEISDYIRENDIKYCEIRSNITENCTFEKELRAVLHLTNLTKDFDAMFNSFKKTQVQQPIMKSVKEGLAGYISDEAKDMELFYKLHTMTRKKLGVPVQPKKYFWIFHENIIKAGFGFISVVKKNGVPMSAGILAGYGDTISYKYGASDPNYLRLRPNNMMIWQAMKESVLRGYKIFDFGRTDLSNQGLRKFKSGWNTEEIPLYYSYYPRIPHNLGRELIKTRMLAPIIKHTPPLVCRIIGEALYKKSV